MIKLMIGIEVLVDDSTFNSLMSETLDRMNKKPEDSKEFKKFMLALLENDIYTSTCTLDQTNESHQKKGLGYICKP